MKKEISYKTSLDLILSDKSMKDKNSGINDIINLDVARTFFDYDAEKTRKVNTIYYFKIIKLFFIYIFFFKFIPNKGDLQYS